MVDASDPQDQELYACNSCTFEIRTHLARVTCHSCLNYHLCANCYVIKAFNRPHTNSHSTMVFKQSGVVVPLPPGFAPRPPPALPPRTKLVLNEDPEQDLQGKRKGKEPELGAANWSALWSIMKAPLEKKNKKSPKGEGAGVTMNIMEPKDIPGSNASDDGDKNATSHFEKKGLPPSPPRSIKRGIERVDSTVATTPSYTQPEKWGAMFESDWTPTPIFVTLMSKIFSHLDPGHTGFLSPEVYSQFLEMQGCTELNIWKKALDREESEHSKEVADLELSLYFNDLSISHNLSVRVRDPSDSSDEEPQSAVEGKIRNSLRFNANMPMISRQGFIDVCAVKYLKDPTKAHGYLGKVVKEYGIWEELGDIPRDVLPKKSTAKLLDGETETLEVEVAEKEHKENRVRASEEAIKENGKVSIAKSTSILTTKETKGDERKESEEPKPHARSSSSNTPQPIETGNIVSPITIGSPAIPFQLGGGEMKIDAPTQGEGFEPKKEGEQTQGYEEDKDANPEIAKISEKTTQNTEKKSVEKLKRDELSAKKPSTEDLYGTD